MLLNPSSPVLTTVSFFRFVFEIVIIHNFRVVLDGSSGSPCVCHRTSLKEMFLNLILWGLYRECQERLQAPVPVCHGVKAASVAVFANRRLYKPETWGKKQGSLVRFPQPFPLCYCIFWCLFWVQLKVKKVFLWNWGTSTLLCALNFPEGDSGGENRHVVKGPFPAILIGSNTNPFTVSLPSLRRTLYAWCKEFKSLFF